MTTLLEKPSSPFVKIPPLRWEQVACNLCGLDDAEVYHRERLPYFDKMVDFEIVRCRHCSLVYTNPRLSDYNATYLWGSMTDAQEIESHARAKALIFRAALDNIHHWQLALGVAPAGRLLDIGCGSGHFVRAAQARGFDGCGIEPAQVSAEYAREVEGVKVFHEDLYDIELPSNHYDVITAWDVLEHVSDPQAMLSRCAGWLRPGGLLALRFPSATWQKIKGVIFQRLLFIDRPSFGPTMHLYFFNEDTFSRMGEQVGLEVLQTKTTAAEANTHHTFLDGLKVASQMAIRSVDLCSGKHLGNLEVYCRKAPK